MNNETTSVVPAPAEPMAFKVTKILVYLLIFMVSMLGNCTVIAIICRSRIMKSVAGNLLILNLALCDFLTPFLSIPFDMAVEENGGEWLYGSVMCRILSPAATWTTTSSSLTLAAIAFERYRSLMHPFKSRLTITHVKRTIVGIHTFSLLVVIPYAYVLGLNEDDHKCAEQNWPNLGPNSTTIQRQVYTVSLFMVQYVGPLLFMAYMYSQTSKSLFVSTERVRTSSMSSVESSTADVRPRSGSFSNTPMRTESPLSRRVFKCIQQQQNVKITKMFIVVVIIFAICMLPNQVVWLWADFGEGQENKNFHVVSIVFRLIHYTNSCLNPFIFFKFSREFRRGLRRLIFASTCCVNGRRNVSLAYRKWRASRTGTRTTSVTAQTTVGPMKLGRTFSSPPPSLESQSSTSSVFEKEEGNVPVPLNNRTKPQREITSPRGFWKKKMDNLKAIPLCPFLHLEPKEVLINSRRCKKPADKTEVHKMSLTDEIKIDINVNDLLTLPSLVETCC